MIANKSRTGRKRTLGAGMISVTFMAICIYQINIPSGVAQPGGGPKGAIFDIQPAVPTTSSSSIPNTPSSSSVVLPGSASGVTFFLTGKIYRYRSLNQADCQLIPSCATPDDPCFLGTWRAWGEVGDDGKLVLHHTLELTPLNSTIEVQGTTGHLAANGSAASAIPGSLGAPTTGPSEILAIVGGTGRYEGLSGQASIRPYCNPTLAGTSPFRYDRPFCLGVE
jgi:hypothetical protein